MTDFVNPEAIAWRTENERLHREGKPHQWRLFGMIACRPCQAAHDNAVPAPLKPQPGRGDVSAS